MRQLAWLIIATWLLTPLPGAAEWYKYRDENGVWHHSDTLTTEVPFEKRKKAQTVLGADDYLSAEQKEQKRLQEAQAKAATEKAGAEAKKQQKVKAQYKDIDAYDALERKRTELDGIYKNMQEHKRQLDMQKDMVDSPETYQTYRVAVIQYNERAKEYKLSRQTYEQALKQYEQKNKARTKKRN